MINLITPDIVTPESLQAVPASTVKPKASRLMHPTGSGNGKSPHKSRTTTVEIKSMKQDGLVLFYSNSGDAPKWIKIKNISYARLKARDI